MGVAATPVARPRRPERILALAAPEIFGEDDDPLRVGIEHAQAAGDEVDLVAAVSQPTGYDVSLGNLPVPHPEPDDSDAVHGSPSLRGGQIRRGARFKCKPIVAALRQPEESPRTSLIQLCSRTANSP